MLNDLHTHLYGCLTAEDIWELAQKRNAEYWRGYNAQYEQVFQVNPTLEQVFKKPFSEGLQALQQIYQLSAPGPFNHFQTKFNLIIQVCNVRDLAEVGWVTERVATRHANASLSHVEYRMLFPPALTEAETQHAIVAICQALDKVEKASESKFQGRLSLSLPRTEKGSGVYLLLRNMMMENQLVASKVTSVDFCFIEEGYPPKNQKYLFQKILQDNKINPDQALAILYHVGESFADKSLESAVRWVHQAATMGAHRLGHCIALGCDLAAYLGLNSKESVQERRDQIEYDLSHQQKLKEIGIEVNVSQLQNQLKILTNLDPEHQVCRVYDEERLLDIQKRQNFVMRELVDLNICIEVCPTSNLFLGLVEDPARHPLLRLAASTIPLVIGTDDPGIFNTDLVNEINLAKSWLKTTTDWERKIKQNSQNYRSEYCSGRWRK